MKGKFKIDLKKTASPVGKIQAIANDSLAFYMHKNGHFL